MKFPFGKYRAKDFRDIPSDYFTWALANMEKLRPQLRQEMEGELARRREDGESGDQRVSEDHDDPAPERPDVGIDTPSIRRQVREEMALAFEKLGAAMRKRLD